MNISKLTNSFISGNYNNFQINKFSHNPISFKSSLASDTIEFSAKSAQTVTNSQNSQFQKEKEALVAKIDSEISENNSSIAELLKQQKSLEELESFAFSMIENEEFSTQIENSLLTYQVDVAKLRAFSDIDSLLRKQKISPEKRDKQLYSLISKNFPEYLESTTSGSVSQDSFNLVEVAKKLRKEQRKNIEALDPQVDFERSVSKAINSYSQKYDVPVDPVVSKCITSALFDSVGKTSADFIKGLSYKFWEIKAPISSKISHLQNRNESLEKAKQTYLTKFSEDPVSACYYDPYLSFSEKVEKLESTGCFKTINQDDFPLLLISDLCKSGVIRPSFIKLSGYFYDRLLLFDLRDEKNKDVVTYLSDGAGHLKLQTDVLRNYNISANAIEHLPIKKMSFKCDSINCRHKNVILIDTSDEQTVMLLEAESAKWSKTRTTRSKYAFEEEKPCAEKEIPAAYLASLGFGSVATLRKLVETGELAGRIEQIQTEEGTKFRTSIDSSDKRLKKVLVALRDKNPAIASYKDLAKQLGISQKRLLNDIADGKLDIIPEHMFVFDNEYKYIDKRLEKNRAYIETTLFEQEVVNKLKQEQAEQHREEVKQRRIQNKDALSRFNSLRMSLVWHFCPKTRNIGSDLAKKDGHLCSLLAKDAEGEESLTRREQIKVDSYRKEMWLRAGTDELKEGFKQATSVLKQLKENGLSSIEDKEIRKILENYGFVA